MHMIDTGSARRWAEELHAQLLEEGDRVIDATMGNGHDTLRLSRLVGKNGTVYAFDVQQEALDSTRKRLEEAGEAEQVCLFLAGHEHMRDYVTEPVQLVVFNLGWLPGAAHGVTTRTETTLAAVDAALALLAPGGICTVCVYPGHEEGTRELNALREWAKALPCMEYDAVERAYANAHNDPPVLLIIQKAKKRRKITEDIKR